MNNILIVGAGPTGLILAIELKRRGLFPRLIDQANAPSCYSKALAIHSRSLEMLDIIGIADEMVPAGLKIHKLQIHQEQDCVEIELLYPHKTPYPFILILPQSATESFFTKKLQQLGMSVERGVALVELEGQTAVLKHNNGHIEKMQAEWIIGCDGAHSAVRHGLQMPFKGKELEEHFILGDIQSLLPFPSDRLHLFLNKAGPSTLFPLGPSNEWRIIAACKESQNQNLDPPYFQNLLKERIGIEMQTPPILEWQSYFSIHQRRAKHMRKKGIFLSGDAAHIHSPAGGQGLNCSIQDAFNLAWKLALVIQKQSPSAILKTYEEERKPVAKAILRRTGMMTRMWSWPFKLQKHLFFPFLRFLSKTPSFVEKLTLHLSQIDVAYLPNLLIGKKYSSLPSLFQPGQRAPFISLDNGKNLNEQLRDRRFLLVYFGMGPLPQWASQFTLDHSKLITLSQSLEGYQYCKDGLPSLCLIRPDGYIGWCGKAVDEKGLMRYLKRIFIKI